jgi:hypothetical protein
MGPDYPFDMADYDPIGHVRALDLDDRTLNAVCGGNAAVALGLVAMAGEQMDFSGGARPNVIDCRCPSIFSAISAYAIDRTARRPRAFEPAQGERPWRCYF